MATPTSGVIPTDFILQAIIESGLAWFRANAVVAASAVWGPFVTNSFLTAKYGQTKIDELRDFILATDIPVVQHWSMAEQRLPCFSVQLFDGGEAQNEASMMDYIEAVDTFDGQGNVIGRSSYLVSPIRETIHVGIHVANSPDIAKYLYYFLVYLLIAFKPTLEANGIDLSSYAATDVSRLNEWLPANVFTRFVNVTMRTQPEFLPQVADQIVTAIQGVQIPPAGGTISLADISMAPGEE